MNDKYKISVISAIFWQSVSEISFKEKFISIKEAHFMCEMEKSDGY